MCDMYNKIHMWCWGVGATTLVDGMKAQQYLYRTIMVVLISEPYYH